MLDAIFEGSGPPSTPIFLNLSVGVACKGLSIGIPAAEGASVDLFNGNAFDSRVFQLPGCVFKGLADVIC